MRYSTLITCHPKRVFTRCGVISSPLKQTLSKQKGISPNEVEKAWLGTVPEGRLADPSELGQVIAFLASPAASFVRGVSLPVDGGRTGSI